MLKNTQHLCTTRPLHQYCLLLVTNGTKLKVKINTFKHIHSITEFKNNHDFLLFKKQKFQLAIAFFF